MSLEKLIEASHHYGNDSAMVLLGGGNTSYKDGNTLYVKASGYSLGSIEPKGFVRMDLQKMQGIWSRQYSLDDNEREDQVLSDMMDCRLAGESARPSVEALLHALLPFTYVVHLHPALVNGVTCARQGEKTICHLFPSSLWLGLVKPGYILAETVKKAMAERFAAKGETPQVIFLQNHGLFVGADNLAEVQRLYDDIIGCIQKEVTRNPDFTPLQMDGHKAEKVVASLKKVYQGTVVVALNKEFQRILGDDKSFYPVSSAFTPDHIVYSGFKPLWVGILPNETDVGAAVLKAYERYVGQYGAGPKIICVQNLGVFAFGENALKLFTDTVAVSVYSESFGGPLFMDEAMIDFIRTWEVEKYRSSIVSK
jgi:rhamnose utilization protein RhaD (predicted bifunctional aldolase and dehydrogenase)